MPIFEYICRDCDAHFEAIVFASRPASCPSCAGRDLDRQLSVFAVSTKSGGSSNAAPMAGCGTCGDPRGPGACSMD